MTVKIGVVGKPSSGKSTFFSAATLVNVPIASYPFTTIKPNIGTTFVTNECVEKEFRVKCNPNNSKCVDGTRLTTIQLVDVAGLVPEAHLGKGMGNQFLSDLADAEGLIHVVDLSGKTNEKGEPCQEHDPEKDILFLEEEIDYCIKGILEKNWKNIQRKAKTIPLYEAVYEQVSGLRISKDKVKEIIEEGFSDLLDLAKKIRKTNKPIILAGNKIDLDSAKENYKRLKEKHDIIPVSAEAELVLRKADEKGLIHYIPGEKDFEVLKQLTPEQEKALQTIREKVLDVYGSTGVQKVINKLVFEMLEYFPVYPVENEHKLTDGKGRILPDVYLVKKGSTVLDLAFAIHSEIGERFVNAFDCRKKMRISKDYVLKPNDVVKIFTR